MLSATWSCLQLLPGLDFPDHCRPPADGWLQIQMLPPEKMPVGSCSGCIQYGRYLSTLQGGLSSIIKEEMLRGREAAVVPTKEPEARCRHQVATLAGLGWAPDTPRLCTAFGKVFWEFGAHPSLGSVALVWPDTLLCNWAVCACPFATCVCRPAELAIKAH